MTTDSSGPAARRPGRDRARLDEVFGTVLFDTTADERGHTGVGDADPPDDWYLRNRPPHHDR
ncbi:hypothetical protein [Saccharomonospora saliphila]|uniref:hypothetical protein n=1 Tax=Saccharomonospora saliphila TaxID=369829 RepID=UPI000377DA13|nr:hypothetical protein [Saccharomonospora saliphila]